MIATDICYTKYLDETIEQDSFITLVYFMNIKNEKGVNRIIQYILGILWNLFEIIGPLSNF